MFGSSGGVEGAAVVSGNVAMSGQGEREKQAGYKHTDTSTHGRTEAPSIS